MKLGNPLRHLVFAFVLALVLYVVAYYAIEHRRLRNGPWEVTFTCDDTRAPKLAINQAALGITNLEVCFKGQGNSSVTQAQTIVFAQPRPVPFSVPYGECIFMDTTFLPGTVTFRLLGHEIELLPRTLIIDRSEKSWLKSGIMLLDANAPTNQATSAISPTPAK